MVVTAPDLQGNVRVRKVGSIFSGKNSSNCRCCIFRVFQCTLQYCRVGIPNSPRTSYPFKIYITFCMLTNNLGSFLYKIRYTDLSFLQGSLIIGFRIKSFYRTIRFADNKRDRVIPSKV